MSYMSSLAVAAFSKNGRGQLRIDPFGSFSRIMIDVASIRPRIFVVHLGVSGMPPVEVRPDICGIS